MEAQGWGFAGNNVEGGTIYEQNNVQSLHEVSENEAGKFSCV